VYQVIADKAACPVLLSNGDCVERGDLPSGRHYTVWKDPHPKPCYLFAVVAGNLVPREAHFTTSGGRRVSCKVWTTAAEYDKSEWALSCVLKAMKWDEERFGLQYDLDEFNVVSTPDFTMGAMENKSLNVFNSRLVLATPETATDADFNSIEAVIGHEVRLEGCY
jgi:aminopeptidase N